MNSAALRLLHYSDRSPNVNQLLHLAFFSACHRGFPGGFMQFPNVSLLGTFSIIFHPTLRPGMDESPRYGLAFLGIFLAKAHQLRVYQRNGTWSRSQRISVAVFAAVIYAAAKTK